MSGARRFLFGDDFSAPARERREAAERAGAAETAALETARREAFARGLDAGRAEAAASAARALTDATERLANGIGMALAEIDGRAEAIERDALSFFDAVARAFAGRAVAAQPLAAIAEAAAEAFRHLRGVPHLAVRVNEALVDEVEALLRRMARDRGYEGRIIVLGEADMDAGDARLDWADGGVASERGRLERAVEEVLGRTAAILST